VKPLQRPIRPPEGEGPPGRPFSSAFIRSEPAQGVLA
jgi:hypothetical protein